MIQTFLFIGGTNDGRRIALPEKARYVKLPEFVPEPPKEMFYEKMRHDARGRERRIEEYWLERFNVGAETVVEFYLHQQLRPEDGILMLVDRYPMRRV